MPRVICALPNASNTINGFAFEGHDEGKISVESLPDEVAAVFATIEGYRIVEDEKKTVRHKKEPEEIIVKADP